MFHDSQTLSSFIKGAFPELSEKLMFAALLKKDREKRSIALFFDKIADEPEINRVRDFLQRLPGVTEVKCVQSEKIPLTDMIVLREIKTHQPVSDSALLLQFDTLRFAFEEIELKRILDKLRKAGMILRSNAGKYKVTEQALGRIPHGNYSGSTDIKRLLELGKRKW